MVHKTALSLNGEGGVGGEFFEHVLLNCSITVERCHVYKCARWDKARWRYTQYTSLMVTASGGEEFRCVLENPVTTLRRPSREEKPGVNLLHNQREREEEKPTIAFKDASRI